MGVMRLATINPQNVIQYRAMRVFLRVHKYAPVAGLRGDMGWVRSMVRFWNRLLSMDM